MNKKLNAWVLASRPKTLLAAFVPVMVGTAAAFYYNKLNITAALTALICSILIQVGTNFVNDLFDFLSGKDTELRIGPKRALASGLISEKEMKVGIFIVFGLAFLLGLYLVSITGIEILILGIISIIAGISYTAGPYPLAYNGLGDIFVFIFFGIVATVGTFYVQTNYLINEIFFLSIPVGLLITNILVVNNYRDVDEDKKNNKNTLVVKFGKKFTRYQYVFSIILSFISIIYLYHIGNFTVSILLPLALLPMAIKMINMLYKLQGKELNNLLELTAKFSFFFGVLLSIGIML